MSTRSMPLSFVVVLLIAGRVLAERPRATGRDARGPATAGDGGHPAAGTPQGDPAPCRPSHGRRHRRGEPANRLTSASMQEQATPAYPPMATPPITVGRRPDPASMQMAAC
jgi:hypothetical protein